MPYRWACFHDRRLQADRPNVVPILLDDLFDGCDVWVDTPSQNTQHRRIGSKGLFKNAHCQVPYATHHALVR